MRRTSIGFTEYCPYQFHANLICTDGAKMQNFNRRGIDNFPILFNLGTVAETIRCRCIDAYFFILLPLERGENRGCWKQNFSFIRLKIFLGMHIKKFSQ
jgi:hypothetical protein